MQTNEAELLNIGDYVKRSSASKSDEYYMITCVDENFKLRKVGDQELLILEALSDFENFTKIDTSRK